MGTGTYRINGRRVTMLRIPPSWRQRETSSGTMGRRWLFPFVVGVDSLPDFDGGSLEDLLPSELVTLTALPGLELGFQVRPNWQLKPFVQLGGGRDFSSSTSFAMAHLGLRSLTEFALAERWNLLWGNAVRWAGEYQFGNESRTSFGLLETGLDLRRDMPFTLFGQAADIGIYTVYQRYVGEWDIGNAPPDQFRTRDLGEFGVSIGLEKHHRFLRIPIRRVRIGYKKGGSLTGWTIGTEFPF